MAETGRIRPKLREQVTGIKESVDPADVALRALYRLYFDSKKGSTPIEKSYLIGESFGFGPQNDIPHEEDNRIFQEEYNRHYKKPKEPKRPKKPKK